MSQVQFLAPEIQYIHLLRLYESPSVMYIVLQKYPGVLHILLLVVNRKIFMEGKPRKSYVKYNIVSVQNSK